jgi:hypothetical protein
MERTSESPSRHSVSSNPGTSLTIDTDYMSRRSSSIPPTPVTPIDSPMKRVRSSSSRSNASRVSRVSRVSRFAKPDMVDEDMPMDEMWAIRRASHNKPDATLSNVSGASSVASNANPVYDSDDSRQARRPGRPKIPQSPKREPERTPPAPSVEPERMPRASSVDAADRGGGHLIPAEDSIAAIGQKSSVGRLATAIRQNATRRPEKLNIEEKALWDVVQTSLATQRNDLQGKRGVLERKLQESASQLDKLRIHNLELRKDMDTTSTHLQAAKRQLQAVKAYQFNDTKQGKTQVKELETQVAELQQKYEEAVSLTEAQQEEHDRAIRAIQRVMVDVNEQNEEGIAALQAQVGDLQKRMEKKAEMHQKTNAIESSDVANSRARAQRTFQLESEMEELKNTLTEVEEERDQLQVELDQKAGQSTILEQELIAIKNAVANAKDKELGFVQVITQQRKQLMERTQEQRSAPPKTRTAEEGNEIQALEKELDERSTSLENAKKLILSLEVANGSMAADLKAKLKIKDEQVLALKAEAADRKRTIDSFATELKNLQNEQAETVQSDSNNQEGQKRLAEKLEAAISDLQSATVVFESSGPGDQDSLDEISVILCNALMALKVSLRSMEDNVSHDEVSGQARTVARANKEPPNAQMREELRKRDVRLRMMEASLRTAQGEVELVKLKNERLQLEKDQDEVKMEVEIRHLRDECKTNLGVLARKEQELQVLRDSLELSDGVGYISGDESDEDEDQRDIIIPSVASSSYTASRAEALASLLARSGSGVDVNVSSIEIEKFNKMVVQAEREKDRAKMELKTEKESLANAKMIISSLEKANKTMLEDLRSRLQDSNTAIAALLDKSMFNESSTSELQSELERVKRDKLKAEREHQNEIAKLKDEALVSALRLAAKEREIREFKDDDEEDGEDNKVE